MIENQHEYECSICKDQEGYLNANNEWERCECKAVKQIKRLFKSSHITYEFQKLGFKNFMPDGRPQPVKDAYNCATTYFRKFDGIKETRQNSIALLGTPGAGKTHLLMAISNNLMNQGVGVLYFPWVEGFNELKDDLGLLETKIHRMQTVPVLFIDDLFKGRKNPTDFQIEQLFAIVNYRYLNHLPIMISSERDIDDICEIDMGLGSRIKEMCNDYTVILKGVADLNYRLRS